MPVMPDNADGPDRSRAEDDDQDLAAEDSRRRGAEITARVISDRLTRRAARGQSADVLCLSGPGFCHILH